MKVLVYDIAKPADTLADEWYGPDRIDSFYADCDYIVMSLPLLESTRHMIDKTAFSKMKKTAVFINVARGPLVKTEDLIDALKNEVIKGAALDVYEQEPLPADSPLWELPNIYMSSHKAGMGDSWKGFIGALFMRNMDHYNKGEELENRVRL